MPEAMNQTLDVLRRLARGSASKANVPYSGRPEAAVLLLSDGTWVPGVRVESASFSLLIPALVNACATAVAAARTDVVAVALSRPALPEDRAFFEGVPWGTFLPRQQDAFIREGTEALPVPRAALQPFLDEPVPENAAAGIERAREVARRAYVPASGFRVGCVLQLGDGHLVPGVNVEHRDWSRTLCAERTALGTALSYGLSGVHRLYLSCLDDPDGTPCGACRQLFAEHAPEAELWMDRGSKPPEAATVHELLPGFFTGQGILLRS